MDKFGQAITCSEQNRQLFEYSKARNICDCLPKTLKKMQFKVEAIPDIPIRMNLEGENQKQEQKILVTSDYEPPNTVTRWTDKFAICENVLDEARKRKDEINAALSSADRELSNIIHTIELEPPKDLYRGYLLYKAIRENRKKRRYLKDELLVISSVLQMNCGNLSKNRISKMIDKLADRKFTYRIVDEDEEVNMGDNV